MGESYTDGIVSENVEVDLSNMNDSYENTRRSAQKQDLSIRMAAQPTIRCLEYQAYLFGKFGNNWHIRSAEGYH